MHDCLEISFSPVNSPQVPMWEVSRIRSGKTPLFLRINRA